MSVSSDLKTDIDAVGTALNCCSFTSAL